MKHRSVAIAFLGLLLQVAGQEKTEATAGKKTTRSWEVSIPEPSSDGKPATPSSPPGIPRLLVTESRTIWKDVVESPPMPGLPPVEGRISATVRKVVDPDLPELAKPLPPLSSPNDPEVQARIEEFREKNHGFKLNFVSATVYDHSRTFLRIYPIGTPDSEVTAWTNIDFNHFCGFTSFLVTAPDGTTKDYSILMGIGNEDTGGMEKFFSKSDKTYKKPKIPRMRDVAGGPAFVIVDGKDSGSEALETLERIHEFYAKEGRRMKAAYLRHEIDYKKRYEYLRANPPKPKDVVLNYWRGKRPQNTRGEANP